MELVEVKPIQRDRHYTDLFHRTRTRIVEWVPYQGRYFTEQLTTHRFKKILRKSHVQMSKVSIVSNPQDLIFYQYEGRPLLILDLKEGKYFTTKGTLKHYDRGLVEHQAYIVTAILRKHGYSLAKRKKARFMRDTDEQEERG